MKGINNGPHQDKRNKVMDLIRIKGIRSRTYLGYGHRLYQDLMDRVKYHHGPHQDQRDKDMDHIKIKVIK